MGVITLEHGEGGELTNNLIESLFLDYFKNDILMQRDDAAVLPSARERGVITTDSYVINPIFFPGGDIGKLAVCGTVNDLAVSGARPMFLTVAFIIEEGLPLTELEKVVSSMADTAVQAGIKIISGDTKVVERGMVDKIYINTTGIGYLIRSCLNIQQIKPGDKLIINGGIGEHGISILAQREEFNFHPIPVSDCSLLHNLTIDLLTNCQKIRFLRDPTRGGLAVCLHEIANQSGYSVEIDNKLIPIKEHVHYLCELLGLDPLYLANEGKMVIIVAPEECEQVLEILKQQPLGKEAAVIGEILPTEEKRVYLKTALGGTRILTNLTGITIPRIC